MSIRLRLTLWHTALFGLVLTLFATLVYVAVSRQLTSQLDYAIHLQALDTSRTLHTVTLGLPSLRTQRFDLPTGLAGKQLYVQLLDPQGKLLASSDNLRQPIPASPTSLRSALAGQEVHDTLSLPEERLELYSAPLTVDDKFMGVLQVAASLQPLERSLAQLRLILVFVVLGAMTCAAGLGWFLATKAMRPVDQMTRTAQLIGRSADFARRLPEPAQRDELGRLALTFNEMLAQLDSAFTTQQRFLADASHELRTPLTALATNIASLLRGAGVDPAAHDDTLRAMAREIDRMGRIVADLLALARAEAGQPIDRQPIALDTLLLEVYRQAKPMANGVRLTLGELEQVAVEGDADRLKQVMLNLVDNALRYTPPPGRVTLDLVARDGWAVLSVHDTGLGIPAAHLSRIFDRFYRGVQARSRVTAGTGLGLAICKWVAEAHGGRIEVLSHEGAGSTFTLYVPAQHRPELAAPKAASSLRLNTDDQTLTSA